MSRSGHLTDEELSALVDRPTRTDGAANAGGEAAGHLAVCVECTARLALWRSSIDRLGAPVVVPADARAAAVAEAMEASADMLDRVARIEDQRRLERRRYERWKVLSRGAAAVVVVAAAGYGLSRVAAHSGSSKAASDSASTAASARPSAGASARASAGASSPAGSGSSARPSVPSYQFGTLTGVAGVERAVRSALAGFESPMAGGNGASAKATPTVGSSDQSSGSQCAPPTTNSGGSGSTRLLLVGHGVYRSTPAVIDVVQTGAVRTAIVYRASSCQVLARIAI